METAGETQALTRRKRPRRLKGAVLDLRATAEELGITEKMATARAARGLIPSRLWGGRRVVLRHELAEFLSRLPGVGLEEALANVQKRLRS
jgi:hypothetical protein